jgi:hypothetical protein
MLCSVAPAKVPDQWQFLPPLLAFLPVAKLSSSPTEMSLHSTKNELSFFV